MKKFILYVLQFLNRFLYPRYDVKHSVHPPLTIFKIAFFQKVMGFNRQVPWPVHWTSTIVSPEKIIPGTRTPGLGKSCHIDGRNGIVIEENVWIGPRVSLISMNHDVHGFNNDVKTKSIVFV